MIGLFKRWLYDLKNDKLMMNGERREVEWKDYYQLRSGQLEHNLTEDKLDEARRLGL